MYGTGNSFNLTSLGLITSNTTKGDTCIFSETILGAEDSDYSDTEADSTEDVDKYKLVDEDEDSNILSLTLIAIIATIIIIIILASLIALCIWKYRKNQ